MIYESQRLLMLSGRECFLDKFFFWGVGKGLFAFFWFCCCRNLSCMFCCFTVTGFIITRIFGFYYYRNNLSKTSIFYKTHYSFFFVCLFLFGGLFLLFYANLGEVPVFKFDKLFLNMFA